MRAKGTTVSKSRLCTALSPALIACALAFAQQHATAAPTLFNIGIEGVKSEDIDALIAHHGRLVTAIESFLAEGGGLNKAIDQAMTGFKEVLRCTVDYGSLTVQNTVERALPDVPFLRNKHSRACDNATLMGGSGGTLDRFAFDHCVIRNAIVEKPVGFDRLSSIYAGMKDIAYGAYCQVGPTDQTASAKEARGNYGQAGMLNHAYAEISKLKGCDQSTPRKQYECAMAYGNRTLELLKAANEIDRRGIDLKKLEAQIPTISPPTTTPPIFFWRDSEVLSVSQLVDYQTLIVNMRRAENWVEASLYRRETAYKRVTSTLSLDVSAATSGLNPGARAIEQRFRQCSSPSGGYCFGLHYPGFTPIKDAHTRASSACRKIRNSQEFKDLVTRQHTADCAQADQNNTKMSGVLAYFEQQSAAQERAHREQSSMDRGPGGKGPVQ